MSKSKEPVPLKYHGKTEECSSTPEKSSPGSFRIPFNILSVFGSADNQLEGKAEAPESVFSDDSGLNSSSQSEPERVEHCEIALTKEILDLAGDTWPIQEALLFRSKSLKFKNSNLL